MQQERKERDEQITKFIRRRKQEIFGPRFIDASLAKIDFPDWAQDRLAEFMEKKKNFLVFCGSPGYGKTYLCAALLDWCMETFESFRYWNEGNLLQRIRDGMQNDKGDYLKNLKFLIDDPFVMLDDVGSQGVNEWRAEIIFDAIDNRYNSMLPTVITSNFTRKEFEQQYHPRLISRLFARENTIIEIHDGLDKRK